jgi:hypothetical protein
MTTASLPIAFIENTTLQSAPAAAVAAAASIMATAGVAVAQLRIA